MSRKTIKYKKRVSRDLKYDSAMVMKLICMMTYNGKRSLNTKAVYYALDELSKKVEEDPLVALEKVMLNICPQVEVKSRRVGGSTYQVPIETSSVRSRILGFRWIIQGARARNGRFIGQRLAGELLDAYNNTGIAIKRKEDLYRMAEANRAFAHYR